MNIFISWSGELSKQIGEIFKDWMPTVIQSIKPYFTPSDIEKGSRWEGEISKKLSECNVGIIILTKANLGSQWIMFEAGALSNNLDKSRVCPILIEVDNSDLTGPLSTFQTTKFCEEDIRQLMSNVNLQCGDSKLSEKVFDEVFKVFWPHLEDKVTKAITTTSKRDNNKVKRPDREILEEILELTRMNLRRNSEFRGSIIKNRKNRIGSFIFDYLKASNTRFKEFPLVDPEEVCSALENIPEVRELANSREFLFDTIVELLEMKNDNLYDQDR